MPIHLHCPHCQRPLSVNDSKAGAHIHCPMCTRPLPVPAAIAPAPRNEAAPPLRMVTPAAAQVVPRPVRPAQGLAGLAAIVDWRSVGIAAVLAVVCVAGTLGLVTGAAAYRHLWHARNAASASTPAESHADPLLSATDVAELAADTVSEDPKPIRKEPAAVAPPVLPAPDQPPMNPEPRPEPANPAEDEPEPKPEPAPVLPAVKPPPKVAVKRMNFASDEDLRKQLVKVRELNVDSRPGTSSALVREAKIGDFRKLTDTTPRLLSHRADLAGLPMRMGADCHLGKEATENLQILSRKLRDHLIAAIPKDTNGNPAAADMRPDPNELRNRLMIFVGENKHCDWLRPEAIPTLVQMLQAENTPIRLLLIDLLALVKDQAASAALAQRALFDLSAEVRAAAITALAERPRQEYRPALLDGFRYPWAAAAEHAAEALVALQDKAAVPALTELLKEPEPTAPFVDTKNKKESYMVRELVRVNHLSNCLMCHAPSLASSDPVRGLVPTPGQPLPPPTTPYYGGTTGVFVRADITYLKQDFSVPQPVDHANNWPATQRYDYLIQTRPVTREDLERKPTSQRREAIFFALNELDENWRQFLTPAKAKP